MKFIQTQNIANEYKKVYPGVKIKYIAYGIFCQPQILTKKKCFDEAKNDDKTNVFYKILTN